jgi:predicted DCC family thiol-disulfide oxidoreductase YuxK
MERVPILYDDDCRFCRATLGLLLAWDRSRRLRPVAIQSEEGSRLLAQVPEEEWLESAHAVMPGTQGVVSGGAAAGPVLRLLPAGAPLARLADRVPGAADRGYRWVAENRGPLSRLVPVALKDRADALVRERSAGPPGS